MSNELKFGNKVVFLNGNPLTLPVRASDPGSAVQGDMYYNSASQLVKFYDGSAWQEMSSGSVNLEGQVLSDGEILIGNASNESVGVVPSGDVVISNSGVTSISAGVIVNADINASAGIVYSKLSIADGDLSIAKTSGLQSALDGKVDENAAITGATKTKITYDAKGLVTAGDDAGISDITGLQSALDGKVDENVAITGATKTKITYDAKGLVTAGADATTSDISEGSNLYFTDSRAKDAAVDDAIVNGVTDVAPSQNAVFDALALKISSSEKGANDGVATLDSGGKIPVSQLPSSVMEFKGNWNASTNSPTLADGTGDAGDVYRVNVAGTQDLGSGSQTFSVGDWVVYNGSIWQLSNNSNAVMSVNGQTGVVVLDSDDVSEGVSNLYFSDERAQDAVGAMVDDSSKISLTYTDGTPSLVADIVAGSLVNADISASAAVAYSKLNLSGSIVNADINASAAIVYSKLSIADGDLSIAKTSGLQSALDGKVDENAPITGATKTKITYDAKGLVTAGADLAASDMPSGIDAAKLADGSVSNTELQYINSVTSNVQDQLDDKANDVDVIKKDGSVAFTGDQDMGGNALTDSTRLEFVAPKVGRSQDGSNFIEEQYVDAITLTGSATVSAAVYAAASYVGAHVEYVIKSNAGEVRTGKVYIANKADGSSVSMSDQFSETADCEVILSADFSTPNIRLRAANANASSGTMRLDIKLIRA